MKDYHWKGNKLYNIKKLDWDYCGKDISANWKDSDGKEKLGKFKLSELGIISAEVEYPLKKDGSINWGKKKKKEKMKKSSPLK